MGEKLPLRSLDDVEGEVGFDGARTRPLVLLLKELGGPKDCEDNWVSGRHEEWGGNGVPRNHSGSLRRSSFYAPVQAFLTNLKGHCWLEVSSAVFSQHQTATSGCLVFADRAKRLCSPMSGNTTPRSTHCSRTDGKGCTHPCPRLVPSWAAAACRHLCSGCAVDSPSSSLL
jgi:hypothetical protein